MVPSQGDGYLSEADPAHRRLRPGMALLLEVPILAGVCIPRESITFPITVLPSGLVDMRVCGGSASDPAFVVNLPRSCMFYLALDAEPFPCDRLY